MGQCCSMKSGSMVAASLAPKTLCQLGTNWQLSNLEVILTQSGRSHTNLNVQLPLWAQLYCIRIQRSDVASTGTRGQECPAWQRKICQKLGIRGKEQEKSGTNQEKSLKKRKSREEKVKSGRFFDFAPPVR